MWIAWQRTFTFQAHGRPNFPWPPFLVYIHFISPLTCSRQACGILPGLFSLPPPVVSKILYHTRSLGAPWAPTSSWRPFGLALAFGPFGPAWLCPLRPLGAQKIPQKYKTNHRFFGRQVFCEKCFYWSARFFQELVWFIHHICHFCSTDKIFGFFFAPHKST